MWLDSLGPMEADPSPVSPLELDPLSPIVAEHEEFPPGELADADASETPPSQRRTA